ncbi:MAG: lipid-A-disaccharide synthase [Bacteroidales bacterium]|nr:lipid-A-disaccharide synthase [Bacteroidales bacterium]
MKYYIIAGESSGDLHGSNLMKAILTHDSDAEIRFWGGDRMAAVGGTCVKHIRDLSFMGFVEVVRHLRQVLGNIAFCKNDIVQFHPDAIIYIDFPGFNLRVADFAHKHGFRNFYYISPQLWAWKKGRIRKMRTTIDRLFCILPFEEDFYKRNNFPQAQYVGHPLLDAINCPTSPTSPTSSNSDTQALKHSSNQSIRHSIALLPGSRRQELSNTMPGMLALASRHPEYDFVIAGMDILGAEQYSRYGALPSNVRIRYNQTYKILSESYAAVVCSGTATLETALFNVPQVVCYKANPVSIAIARWFVGKRVRFISLVNLIADRPIVKELLQQDFNQTMLEQEFSLVTKDQSYRSTMREGYADVRRILGGSGASDRVASVVISTIQK